MKYEIVEKIDPVYKILIKHLKKMNKCMLNVNQAFEKW